MASLQINPDSIDTLSVLNSTYLRMGLIESAIVILEKLIELEPQNIERFKQLGVNLYRISRYPEALNIYRAIVKLDAVDLLAWQGIANCLGHIPNEKLDDQVISELHFCVSNNQLSSSMLASILAFYILDQSGLYGLSRAEISQILKHGEEIIFKKTVQKLCRPLILEAMKNTMMLNIEIEHIFTLIRREFLLSSMEEKNSELFEPENIAFLQALSQQCFQSEYVYSETPEELEHLKSLEEKLVLDLNSSESVGSRYVVEILLISTYKPLFQTSFYDFISNEILEYENGLLNETYRQQVREPLQERKIIDSISQMTPIKDKVSEAVQLQYEENSYPRWKSLPFGEMLNFPEFMLHNYSQYIGQKNDWPTHPNILIAGCGTGQHPISTARTIKDINMLAIDLSRSSLAYGIRKSQELGVANIDFAQADILQMGSITKKFDYIESIGVLHHMENPKKGLKILANMLVPGGMIRIALYSEIGRKSIVSAREFIEEKGYRSISNDIKKCRQEIILLEKSHPVRDVVDIIDFYTTSNCRDLLFHVQEHRYTLLEIQNMFDELDLELLCLEVNDVATLRNYKSQYPDDSAAISLKNWHKYEIENPDLFSKMYYLLLRNRPKT
jgi:2-polyprenyl-3-methyl-5-hydroxy-6-metoxy-1,4-benzoquinol methylase